MSPYKDYFHDKVVIITGCGSGIGQSIGAEFAKLDARVVCVDRQLERCIKVCKQLRSLSPSDWPPLQVIADLTQDEEVSRVVSETVSKLGRIDILVNNAAIDETQGSETPSALELFDRVLAINLRASFHLCNQSLRQLSITKGSIINVSALKNLRTSTDFNTLYHISKSGMDAMTRSLSTEWSKFGIRVNSVNLGHILTTSLDESIPRLLLDRLYPMGRFGRPTDVANAVVFLASHLAQFVNGVNLEVDGGYHNSDGLTGALIARQYMTSDAMKK